MEQIVSIALMRVPRKAIVLTTKSRFDVKKTYASIRGLVVRKIALGKTRINAIINHCYIASAKTKRDWLIHGHVALNKCNVSLGQSLGQQVSNCCPLGPAAYINKQNGGESCNFVNSNFRAFCLKKYTID